MARTARKAVDPRAPASSDAPDTKHILTRVDPEGFKALRILALELNAPMQALGIMAFNDLLAKHGKKVTVRNPLLDSE